MLHQQYGSKANMFGAATFVQRLAAAPVDDEAIYRVAMTVAVADYYHSRVTLPRATVGGSTNPVNRKRWVDLRPFLIERIKQTVALNASGSLLNRAIFASIAEDWLSAELLERQVKKQFEASKMFESVDVQVDLELSVAGGRTWLRGETTKALEQVKATLAKGEPALIELLRDPAVPPTAAQVVIVFRIEERSDGRLRLDCFEPTNAAVPVAFDVRIGPDSLMIYDLGPNDEHAAPKGLRVFEVSDTSPPLFGLRRHLRRFLPWRLFWWIKRRWLLVVNRKLERLFREGTEVT